MRLSRGFAAPSLVVLVVVLEHGCRVDESSLDRQLWFCDPHAAAEQCGTHHGRPMQCYSAEALGGSAFCTDSCDPAVPPDDPAHFFCTGSGALLELCTPDTMDLPCPDGLACYRTDLNPLVESGLCLPMPVCSSDADCASAGARSVCISAVVRAAYDEAQLLNMSGLQCVEPCASADTASSACADGEVCISDLYALPGTPRICAPMCSASEPCPPNFYCLADAGPAYPAICTPGLPGYRCKHEEDCAVGDCRDTGAGFSICTIDCDPEEDICPLLDSARGPAFCAGSMCVIRSPFGGEFCTSDTDCPTGSFCSDFEAYNPTVPSTPQGHECHRPCSAPGGCPPLGDMPYVCLPRDGRYSECYPADFGLPCAPELDTCMGKMRCLSGDAQTGPSICTLPCKQDRDCATYNLTARGLCRAGVCQLRIPGDPCDGSEQCPTGACSTDGRCQ